MVWLNKRRHIHISLCDQHIYYPTLSHPFYSANKIANITETIVAKMYFIATLIPLFVSSIAWMWCLGIVMASAYYVSTLLFVPSTAST